MGSYRLQCREIDCDTHYIIPIEEGDSLNGVHCPNCESENFEVLEYDHEPNIWVSMAHRIVELEGLVDALTNRLDKLERSSLRLVKR